MSEEVQFEILDPPLEPVAQNIAIQKVARATKEYPEYGISVGDAIGILTYQTSWDDNNEQWQKIVQKFPQYSLVDHEWHTLSNEDPIPEVKVINI